MLALLHRYNADSRDGGRAERMEIVQRRGRRLGLHAGGLLLRGLSRRRVDPANAVNQNKVNSAKDYFLRFLSPKGASK